MQSNGSVQPRPAPERTILLSVPQEIHLRLQGLRAKLEERFGIRVCEEELVAYLCERALDRMEEWERRTRP